MKQHEYDTNVEQSEMNGTGLVAVLITWNFKLLSLLNYPSIRVVMSDKTLETHPWVDNL